MIRSRRTKKNRQHNGQERTKDKTRSTKQYTENLRSNNLKMNRGWTPWNIIAVNKIEHLINKPKHIDVLWEYKYRCIEGIQIWLMHSTIKHFQKNSNSDKMFCSYIYYYIVNMIWYICSCNDINYSSFKFSVVSFFCFESSVSCGQCLWIVLIDYLFGVLYNVYSIWFILSKQKSNISLKKIPTDPGLDSSVLMKIITH